MGGSREIKKDSVRDREVKRVNVGVKEKEEEKQKRRREKREGSRGDKRRERERKKEHVYMIAQTLFQFLTVYTQWYD